MKQNKYSILPAIIEALIILTTSMLTLLLREVPGMMTYIIPITLLVVYILLKFFLSQRNFLDSSACNF